MSNYHETAQARRERMSHSLDMLHSAVLNSANRHRHNLRHPLSGVASHHPTNLLGCIPNLGLQRQDNRLRSHHWHLRLALTALHLELSHVSSLSIDYLAIW